MDSSTFFSSATMLKPNESQMMRLNTVRFLINLAALPYRLWPRTNTRCTRVFRRRPSGCAAPKSPNSAWRSPCRRWPWGRSTTPEKKVLTHHPPPPLLLCLLSSRMLPPDIIWSLYDERGAEREEEKLESSVRLSAHREVIWGKKINLKGWYIERAESWGANRGNGRRDDIDLGRLWWQKRKKKANNPCGIFFCRGRIAIKEAFSCVAPHLTRKDWATESRTHRHKTPSEAQGQIRFEHKCTNEIKNQFK